MKRLFRFIDNKSENFEVRKKRLIEQLLICDRNKNKDSIFLIFQNEMDNLKNQTNVFYIAFIFFLVIVPIAIPASLYFKHTELGRFMTLYVIIEILILGTFLLFIKPIETSKYKKLIDRLYYDKKIATLDNESLLDYIEEVSNHVVHGIEDDHYKKSDRLDARTIGIIIRLLRQNGHFPKENDTCSERAVSNFLFKMTGYSKGMRRYISNPEYKISYEELKNKYKVAQTCLNEIGYHNADNLIKMEIDRLEILKIKEESIIQEIKAN